MIVTGRHLIHRLLEKLSEASFTHLGHVYLGPGWFVKLSPVQYLALTVFGAAWVALAGWLFWRLTFRRGNLLLAGWVLFGMTGAYVTLAYPPTTDEPHYLAIAESLVRDGDIELSGNYRDGDHLKFFPVRELDPHAVVTKDGKMYSQHTAGLPLLVLPGYAALGRWGVLLLLAALAGALLPLLSAIARDAGASRRGALLAVAALAGSAPLLFGSTLVFTEAAAAFLVALALVRIRSPLSVAGAAALLPWLHPRYALISLGLAVLNLKEAKRERGAAAGTLALAAVVSGGAFFGIYHGPALTAVLNTLTEEYPAPIESLTAGSLGARAFGNPAVALLGKLLDRDFGVLPYAPWLLVLLPALAVRGIRRRISAAPFWIAGGAFLLATLLFRNWGGSAYPGRTLLPLLPLAVPYLARGTDWALARDWRRAAFGVLLAVSAGTGWLLTACPVLRYESGRDWVAGRLGPLARLLPFNWFPSFTEGSAALAAPGTLAAVVALAAAAVLLAGKKRY